MPALPISPDLSPPVPQPNVAPVPEEAKQAAVVDLLAESKLPKAEPPKPEETPAKLDMRSYLAKVEEIGKYVLERLAKEGKLVVSRIDQEPNHYQLPIEANGGVAIQMANGLPYRLLTPLGGIPIFRGFPDKDRMAEITAGLGLQVLVPAANTPFGVFGPILAVTRDPSGNELPRAKLREGDVTAEDAARWSAAWKEAKAKS